MKQHRRTCAALPSRPDIGRPPLSRSTVDASETFDLVAPVAPGAALADTEFLLASNLLGPAEFDEPSDPAIMVAMALYGNLAGDPTSLGTALISAADDMSVLSIPLGPAGIDLLNASLGSVVVLGGSVSSVIPPGSPQQPFGFTGPDIPGGDPLTPSLAVVTVPEPTTLASLGLLGLAALRGRR